MDGGGVDDIVDRLGVRGEELAASSDDPSFTAMHVLDNVNVSTPTANQPPTTSTAPANGATFTAPATITVSANASDTDCTIAKVDFFAGSTLIGTDTASPYSVSWSNVGRARSPTAVATDNAGGTTTSAARTITVSGGANQLTDGVAHRARQRRDVYGAGDDHRERNRIRYRWHHRQGRLLPGGDADWDRYDQSLQRHVEQRRGGKRTLDRGRHRQRRRNDDVGRAHHHGEQRRDDDQRGLHRIGGSHHAGERTDVLDIFASGANPNTATPIASQDLGKPAVVSGDCTADITQTFNALAAGN